MPLLFLGLLATVMSIVVVFVNLMFKQLMKQLIAGFLYPYVIPRLLNNAGQCCGSNMS